jgi:hypothetical protein
MQGDPLNCETGESSAIRASFSELEREIGEAAKFAEIIEKRFSPVLRGNEGEIAEKQPPTPPICSMQGAVRELTRRVSDIRRKLAGINDCCEL